MGYNTDYLETTKQEKHDRISRTLKEILDKDKHVVLLFSLDKGLKVVDRGILVKNVPAEAVPHIVFDEIEKILCHDKLVESERSYCDGGTPTR